MLKTLIIASVALATVATPFPLAIEMVVQVLHSRQCGRRRWACSIALLWNAANLRQHPAQGSCWRAAGSVTTMEWSQEEPAWLLTKIRLKSARAVNGATGFG